MMLAAGLLAGCAEWDWRATGRTFLTGACDASTACERPTAAPERVTAGPGRQL